MAREIQVDMSRESVDLEDLSSRLAHKKVCNINLKRNQNTLLKGLEVINELADKVKSGETKVVDQLTDATAYDTYLEMTAK